MFRKLFFALLFGLCVADARSAPIRFEPHTGVFDAAACFAARVGEQFFLFSPDRVAVVEARTSRLVSTMEFSDTNSDTTIIAGEPLPGRSNYLVGDPKSWRLDVPGYASIRYKKLWPGIDAVFYTKDGHLEFDFEVDRAARASEIKLVFPQGAAVRRSQDDLLVPHQWGVLRLHRPSVTQAGRTVRGDWCEQQHDGSVGFTLGAHQAEAPVTIDPGISYSSFLGGNKSDSGYAIAVDVAGNMYVGGETFSSDFPLAAPMRTGLVGITEAFIAKFSPSGIPIYSTYIGGSQWETVIAIAVDAEGNVYAAGRTKSQDFPVTVAFQQANAGDVDAFVLKLDAAGSRLLFSTYLGGAREDMAEDMVINAAGDVFVTGFTRSDSFPTTTGAFQTIYATGTDGFAAKVSKDGSRLIYSTYIGGESTDFANGIAADAEGNAYVVGRTSSILFPATNGTFMFVSPEAFLVKLSADGSRVNYATYILGEGWDEAYDVAIDSLGRPWVVGETGSKYVWATTPNAFRPTPCPSGAIGGSQQDAFVMRFSATGPSPQMLFSTLLCGNDTDRAEAIAIDAKDNVYVVGLTFSEETFPSKASLQSAGTAFLSKINTSHQLTLSTLIGGKGLEVARAVSVDQAGRVYITGYTASTDFPTVAAFQATYGGGFDDGFIIRTDPINDPPPSRRRAARH